MVCTMEWTKKALHIGHNNTPRPSGAEATPAKAALKISVEFVEFPVDLLNSVEFLLKTIALSY